MPFKTHGLILHRGLEEHIGGARVKPAEFDIFIRIATLFHRGVVVTDSDLNNNPLFHEVALRSPDVFEDAIRGGHLVRAARIDGRGEIATQRRTYENLRARNAVRARPVPLEHPGRLDKLLGGQYARTIEWSANDLTSIFHTRCILNLRRAISEHSLGADALMLAEQVLAYLAQNPQAGAADIEQRFKNRYIWGGRVWADVWRLILDSWGGNVSFAFGGQLIVAQSVSTVDGVSPSGPDASNELVQEAAEYYLAIGNGNDEDYTYYPSGELTPGGNSTIPKGYRLNRERLMGMSLDDIAKLRERADPQRVIDLRDIALGSPTALEQTREHLVDASLEYWDRLANLNLAYELREEWLTNQAPVIYANLRAKQDNRDAQVTLARSIASTIPGLGNIVSLLDATEATRTLAIDDHFGRRERFAEEFRHIVFRRPDFRVVEKIFEGLD